MVKNELTIAELKRILLPIIKLEPIEKVKESIYQTMHFTQASFSSKEQYVVSSRNTGYKSMYRKFDIEIRKLSAPQNGYYGVCIQFRKKGDFIDFFVNPINKLVKDIQIICCKEIPDLHFEKFDPGGWVKEEITENFLYQDSAFSPEWEKKNKISPLTVYTRREDNSYLVEFNMQPECYERIDDRTVLTKDWLETFQVYTPSW